MRLITRASYAASVRRPALLEVADDRATYVDRAEHGDAVAAMALFDLDSASTIDVGARGVTTTRGDRDAAWRWLDLAARHGDCEAMAQYARSLPGRLREAAGTLDERDVATLRETAIHYLGVAAERGYRDAFLLLSDAWETGSAGRIDPVLGLTYRLALNRLDGDAFMRRAVRRLERSLSSEDRERASAAASALVRTVRIRLRRARRAGA